jgi:hypothetical protein
MTTQIADFREPDNAGDIATHSYYLRVQLGMRCAGEQVHVSIRDFDGEASALHQMTPGPNGHWTIRLRLRAGTYRYRYYACDQGVIRYVRPADVDDAPSRMEGLDSLLLCQ